MKQNEGILWIVAAIVVVFIIFGSGNIGNIFQLGATVPPDLSSSVGQCSGGWTTLSTSNVNIVPGGNRIRIYGQARGSECLSINLRQSGLDALLNSQGYDATKDIVMNVRLLKYNKIFPVDQSGGYEGNYNNLQVSGTSTSGAGGFSFDPNTLKAVCVSKGYPTAVFAYRPFIFNNIRCVIPGQQGIAGAFIASRSYSDFDVQFDLNGQSVHLTRNAQSVQIGNNYIEWTGNLLSLDEVYSPQYDARLINSKWDLVKKGAPQDMNNAKTNLLTCFNSKNSQGMSDSDFNYCRGIFNTASSQILSSKLNEYQTFASNLVYDVSTDNNNLYVSLKAPPYPSFILDLDATSVGIIALQGKPQITSCISGGELSSGQNKVVSYSVKNNANVNNVQFVSSITCNQGVSPYSKNFNIGAYETKLLTAELIPSNPNQNDLSYSCTLKVSDLKTGASDSCSFSGSVKYVSGIICTPGQEKCSDDGKNIVKCTSDGKNLETVKQCDNGCILNQDGAQCISGGGGGDECKWYQEVRTETGLFSWRKTFDWVPGINPIQSCQTAVWVYLLIIAGIIISVVAIKKK